MGEVTIVRRRVDIHANSSFASMRSLPSFNDLLLLDKDDPESGDDESPSKTKIKLSIDTSSSSLSPSTATPTSTPNSNSNSISSPSPSKQFGYATKKTLGRTFAMKTVNHALMSKPEITEFENELAILRELDHPCIVQLFEVYNHKRKMWLVMECCTGGDLTSRTMSETMILTVMEQILQGLCYLHKRGGCHRDLKLENVMFENPSPNSPIKLIDFGLSAKFTKNVKMQKACGTLYTAAPELILGNGYTSQSDVWSAGCCAFVMLSNGDIPFLRDHGDLGDEVSERNTASASLVTEESATVSEAIQQHHTLDL